MSDIFSDFLSRSAKRAPTGPVEYIIVGLGNPGKQYEYTRHNTGFLTMDLLSDRLESDVDRLKYKSLCGDAMIGSHRVLLMKPQTYMNNSGEAVREAMNFYKLPTERIIVIYDDISLPLGKLRIRQKGTDGGHNGIKSIIALCGGNQFPRIKVGVGERPNPQWDLADWVLSEFSEDEKELLRTTGKKAVEACILMVEGQYNKAMNLISAEK